MKKSKKLLHQYLASRNEKDKNFFFTRIYELYFNRVFAIAISRCEAYAEDITSDVFLKLLKVDPFKLYLRFEELEGLIVRITYNTATDYYRRFTKKDHRTVPFIKNLDNPTLSFDPTTHKELVMSLDEAIKELSARQRKAFLLAWKGYSYKEISIELQTTTKAIRSLLQHGRKKIRTYLNLNNTLR